MQSPAARRPRARVRNRADPRAHHGRPQPIGDRAMAVTKGGPGATIDPPDHEEPWERRFRASAILFSQIAAQSPDVGLVTSNATGLPQLCRWDIASGELTRITD